MNSSARFILSSRSQKAISVLSSRIQPGVLPCCCSLHEKWGPNVYISPKAVALILLPTDRLRLGWWNVQRSPALKSTSPFSFLGVSSNGSVVTLNISPAPSASLAVMMVCAYTQILFIKELVNGKKPVHDVHGIQNQMYWYGNGGVLLFLSGIQGCVSLAVGINFCITVTKYFNSCCFPGPSSVPCPTKTQRYQLLSMMRM